MLAQQIVVDIDRGIGTDQIAIVERRAGDKIDRGLAAADQQVAQTVAVDIARRPGIAAEFSVSRAVDGDRRAQMGDIGVVPVPAADRVAAPVTTIQSSPPSVSMTSSPAPMKIGPASLSMP
ncbi:MAG: hypothetical protein JKP98_20185 [Rhodobacteraceae bacterium]|nr:hypothetical protein [Paracoccaceae bacterium]